jgi:hypothetical protein
MISGIYTWGGYWQEAAARSSNYGRIQKHCQAIVLDLPAPEVTKEVKKGGH